MHVLSFGSQFEMFLCFVLGKCSVNRSQAGREAEVINEAGPSKWLAVWES